MSKNVSDKNYQENKDRLQKKLTKDLSNEEKEKSDNIVVNNKKIYQKMKNKSLLSIEKNIEEEMP